MTTTSTDLNDLFQASQAAWSCLVAALNSRSYQLEVLYQCLKAGNPTESIMQTIAVLDEQADLLREKHKLLIEAHQEAAIARHTQRKQALQ